VEVKKREKVEERSIESRFLKCAPMGENRKMPPAPQICQSQTKDIFVWLLIF